ncbi:MULTISPECIES: hypothetical protein [Gordonia]|uniref:hypothetical protein n=1 Tax=Gordonia TaxID=2053 RepID=UPI0002C0397C|nr:MULTISPECIES: hypothetical protein [Gordonia]EMP13876.1 hypothetical protein ISGA_3612 [Gordonia sp. NB41Y]WLP91237.1 hypothetical protein Q9K23_02870 [Gordonia sp. NB41Y]
MIIARPRTHTAVSRRVRSHWRRGVPALLAAVVAVVAMIVTATGAQAAPETTPETSEQRTPAPGSVSPVPEAEEPLYPTASSPMPVPAGSYGYQATHGFTEQLSRMKAADAIAALPVPSAYRLANLGFAQQFDLALRGALVDPGGCLQLIVNPNTAPGNLFDYGFYAVSGPYCS